MAAGGASISVSSGKLKNPSNFSFVKIDPSALAALLESESGPVARDLIERGERVKKRAQQLVGVSKPDPVPRKKPHRPGTLRDRIVKRMSIQRGKLVVEVGADVPYAMFHHEGWAGGIMIYPKTPYNPRTGKGGFLVFYWKKTGKIEARTSVRQGSFKGNPYLTNALPAASS